MFKTARSFASYLIGQFQKSNYKLGIINVVFTLLLFISPSDKIVFLISIIHLFVMLIVVKSALEALVSVYWPWFIFEFGREFTNVLIPLQHIRSEAYQSPVVSYVLFSPINILIVLLLFFILYNFIFKAKYRLLLLNQNWFLLFVLYVFICLVSVVMTEYSVTFSLLNLIKSVSSMFWLLAVIQLDPSVRRQIIHSLLVTISGLFFLEVILAFFQLLRGGYIGIHAEKAWYVASFGNGADENSSLVRVSGFEYHPNGMANWLFGELIVLLLLAQQIVKKLSKKMVFVLLVIGMLGLSLLSLTRTIIVTLCVTPFLFWSEFKVLSQDIYSRFRKNSRTINIFLFVIIFGVTLVSGYRLKDRIFLSIYATQANGGISTRVFQYLEAIKLTQIKPIFGHGIGMYQAALYNWIPNGEVRYFPERVHNSFLLIAAESGIPSLFIGLLMLLSVLLRGFGILDRRIIAVWLFYGMLYLFLQPVSQEILSFPVVIILLLTTHYEQISAKKNT